MVVNISLFDKYTTFIDDEDSDLSKFTWTAVIPGKHVYAMRITTNTYLHREILRRKVGRNLIKGERTDHINGNSLDNTRSNLRISNASTNTANSNKYMKDISSSMYKGVAWDRDVNKWRASITKDRHLRYIGIYYNEIEAAKAYDRKAIELFGEYARLNFPREE